MEPEGIWKLNKTHRHCSPPNPAPRLCDAMPSSGIVSEIDNAIN